jgi:hypothetical protein
MAVHLSVYRLTDREFVQSPPSAVDSDEFSAWLEECDRPCLFEAPLGTVGAVTGVWAKPAARLGLPTLSRLARVFEEGVLVERGDLARLREEGRSTTRGECRRKLGLCPGGAGHPRGRYLRSTLPLTCRS